MSPMPTLTTDDFQQLLTDYRQLIDLNNELEYCVHGLGQLPPSEPLAACQQASGRLIEGLRLFLFRLDQQAWPVLEKLAGASE